MPQTRKIRNKRNKIKKGTRRNKIKKRNKTKKGTKRKHKRTYKKKDFKSGDGMLTSVWGPSLWHYLHIMSFNYPINPTKKDKKQYKEFIMSLKHVLPCKYCRINLIKNLKKVPLNAKALKNRECFSKWMYRLHEHINKMLKKKNKLTYCDLRERYEHFRARCTEDKPKIIQMIKKENGCVEPLYGKKSKCVIKIIPKDERQPSFQMDKKCIKTRL
jgi:hypothetical protein